MIWKNAVYSCAILAILSFATPANAELVHQWKFNGFATDSVGSAHGTLGGGASLTGGRLSLDGIDGQVLTSPLDTTLTEKTLVSWISLNDLNQPGGGSALSVQVGGGGGAGGFDGIVYAERVPGQWMNGSNGFVRSVPDNGGAAESVSEPGEVMMAITYAVDNSITLYRDGVVYANAANASQGTLNTYVGGTANAIFGRRHDGAPNPLNGFVNEARVYNEVLSESAISDIFFNGPDLTPSDPPPGPPAPELLHQWTFNGSLADIVGGADGSVTGGAQLSGDRLSVDGVAGSRFLTAPLGGDGLGAKSLVAWVSLNDVTNSSKGSALTIENDSNGNIFDGIVYGEVAAQKWMAGSNGFVRTQNPQDFGSEETVGEPGEVMVGIVYDVDNSITLYRDGVEYGSYSKGSLQPFGANAVVQIGPRHGTNPDVFDGFVNEARVYGGALSASEVSDVFFAGPSTDPNPLPPMPPADGLVHQWTFEDGTAADSRGTANGNLLGGAAIVEGRLQLDGVDDYMRSDPIDFALAEKTLVAWVSLDNLTQQSGSALTVENPAGTDTFDGIVYGERVAGQWMAGSNNFVRSVPDNGGASETVAEPGEVMVAIVYAADGSITLYRDGAEYASAANATMGSLQSYAANSADVLIGLRHEDIAGAAGTVDGNDPFLAGFVNEARIYNFALSASEVQDVFFAGPVPEPSTAALSIISLLAMLGLSRRRPQAN